MIERERRNAWEIEGSTLRDADATRPLAHDESVVAAVPSANDTEFDRQMALAREVMRDHRAVLAALAK